MHAWCTQRPPNLSTCSALHIGSPGAYPGSLICAELGTLNSDFDRFWLGGQLGAWRCHWWPQNQNSTLKGCHLRHFLSQTSGQCPPCLPRTPHSQAPPQGAKIGTFCRASLQACCMLTAYFTPLHLSRVRPVARVSRSTRVTSAASTCHLQQFCLRGAPKETIPFCSPLWEMGPWVIAQL